MVAILVIISVFIAFAVVNNTAFIQHKSSINDLTDELKIEKSHILDYVTINNLNSAQTQDVFTNFSNAYMTKLGNDKDSFFIIGTTSNVKIIGYKTSDTDASYYNGTAFVNISAGNVDISTPTSGGKITIKINDNDHVINLYSGQNLYYLINYNYNKEVYIIYG